MRASWPLLLVTLLLAVASDASAGLRPAYGGELVVTAPTLPVETDPALAWTLSEIVQAQASAASLVQLAGPPTAIPGRKGWRFTIPEHAGIDPKLVATRLSAAVGTSVVALPEFQVAFEPPRNVVVTTPLPLPELKRLLALPWLRIPASSVAPFLIRRGGLEADPAAALGRPMVDRIRLEARDGRRLEAAPEALLLAREGDGGRPVFALPRPGSPGAAAIANVLAGLDRTRVARLFVRGHSRVLPGWYVPASMPAVQPRTSLVIAVDEGERDLRTVAERIQLLLRDRKVAARVVAEERKQWRARIEAGDYDLALVPLPPAPEPLQAATLARLANGRAAPSSLRKTAEQVGAVLLYVEGGGVGVGARVRGVEPSTPIWSLEYGDAWILPPGLAP